jgi:hypothetical protein
MQRVKNPFKPSKPRETTHAPLPQPSDAERLQAYLTESERQRSPEAQAGDRVIAALGANEFTQKLEAHERWKNEKAEFEASARLPY